MVIIVVIVSDSDIVCPSNPNNHPKTKNHQILPV